MARYTELETIAASFGVPAPDGAVLRLAHHGRHYEISLNFSSGNPVGVTVWLAAAPRSTVALTQQGSRLGLDSDVTIGEPSFDRAVWIDTNVSAPAVRRMFAREEARRLIIELLAMGDWLKLGGDGVALEFVHTLAIEPIHQIVDRLAQLDSLLAADPPERGRGYGVEIVVVTFAALWAVLGMVSFGLGLERYQTAEDLPRWAGLVIHGGLAALALVIIVLLLRGRPRSTGYITLAAILVLFGVPFHAIGDLPCINGILAPEPPVLTDYRVLTVEPDSEGGPPTLEIAPAATGEVQDLSLRGYGVGARIRMRRGALGWHFPFEQ